jgi:hypothetical protein
VFKIKKHLFRKARMRFFKGGRHVKNLIALILGIMMAGWVVTSGPASAGTETEAHRHGAFTKHYESSLFEVTKNGMYSVEMVVGEHGLLTGVNTMDLIIHDNKDHDVVGAEITVTSWMPEMGHGSYEPPVITEKGGGLYSVENVILIMSGLWELRININKDGVVDTAVFSFPNVQVDRKHEHKMIKAPDNIDLAAEQLSENKKFDLSYKSDIEPIPINKIHSWMLILKKASGEPVTGAEISLDGDMPQHGHGLPTAPEVTQDLGNGEYVVEGVKFSMPGWWVMNFSVKADGEADTATFNLMLEE